MLTTMLLHSRAPRMADPETIVFRNVEEVVFDKLDG